MYRIESKIDVNSAEYKANVEVNKKLVAELRERLEAVYPGGPPHMIERHKKRGKLTVRERLKLLLDRNTPFLELSPLAAN